MSSYLWRNYGITDAEYGDLLQRQKFKCAICRRACSASLSVDHCHETGAVRGLLCRKCNAGLGMFKDDTKVMAKAIEYLERARITRRCGLTGKPLVDRLPTFDLS